MRIGFFADMYLPHVSGVTNHIRLYKRHFEGLGHEVFVFTFGDLEYTDTEPNVIRSPGMPWGETGWRFAFALSAQARAVAETLAVLSGGAPLIDLVEKGVKKDADVNAWLSSAIDAALTCRDDLRIIGSGGRYA